MYKLTLDRHSGLSLHEQIAEQVKYLIVRGELKPGERLPSVRELARELNVNQNTVVRAYLQLEHEQVVVSRRGGGTTVTARADDPSLRVMRQRRLSDAVSGELLKWLSLGYTPEEIEAVFFLHLARWREEKREVIVQRNMRRRRISSNRIVRIVGSHDLALNLLIELLKRGNPQFDYILESAGSLGGLIALQQGRAHIAGIHLLDEETGEYNYPYVKRILPGRKIAVVHLAYRMQGLMFIKRNIGEVNGLEILRRAGIRFINRQKGSGTRIYLDLKLGELGISPREIEGYDREVDTHLAVAGAIQRGEADIGLGIYAAARSYNLDFVPLFQERYDLVIPQEYYHSDWLNPLLKMLSEHEFRELVEQAGGYDVAQMGKTTFL